MKSYKQFRIEQVERLEEEPITTAAVVGGLWKAAMYGLAAKGAYDTVQSVRKKEPWQQTASKAFTAIPMVGGKRTAANLIGSHLLGREANKPHVQLKHHQQKLKNFNKKMNRPSNASAPDSQGNYWVPVK